MSTTGFSSVPPTSITTLNSPDGEGFNARKDVAAIGRDIHLTLVDADLTEQKVDVAVRALGLLYNGDLARQRVSATHAVYLARIR